jgi:hypothetical protein
VAGWAFDRRTVGPFLKEFVKRKRFPPGCSVTGAWGEVANSSGSLAVLNPAFSLSLFRASSRLSSLREVAIVLCRRDCSQHIPSQGTAHDNRKQLCPVTAPDRCGRIWCEFLAVRATPYTATCWPAPPIADESRRIQGPTRVGPHGRDLELPQGNSDRTTGPKLHPSSVLSGVSSSTITSGRLQ